MTSGENFQREWRFVLKGGFRYLSVWSLFLKCCIKLNIHKSDYKSTKVGQLSMNASLSQQAGLELFSLTCWLSKKWGGERFFVWGFGWFQTCPLLGMSLVHEMCHHLIWHYTLVCSNAGPEFTIKPCSGSPRAVSHINSLVVGRHGAFLAWQCKSGRPQAEPSSKLSPPKPRASVPGWPAPCMGLLYSHDSSEHGDGHWDLQQLIIFLLDQTRGLSHPASPTTTQWQPDASSQARKAIYFSCCS